MQILQGMCVNNIYVFLYMYHNNKSYIPQLIVFWIAQVHCALIFRSFIATSSTDQHQNDMLNKIHETEKFLPCFTFYCSQ